MMSRKPSKASLIGGMIMLDIILALALGAVFIVALASASFGGRAIFDRALIRSELMDLFDEKAHEFGGMMPYESRLREYLVSPLSPESARISAVGRWYGNDRIETAILIEHRGVSVRFRSVRAYPFISTTEVIGTPLCSPERPEDIALKAIMLPIDPLLPLTDIEVRNNIAYISADSARASDHDLMIFDISDPKDPKLLSAINTGPGIASFVLAGRYIFAAAASGVAQLHVIKVDVLGSMSLAKIYRLPLPEASTTPPYASAIFYDRGLIYLGTEKWDGDELAVIDVSIPESPASLGGFEVGSKVNDVYIRDLRAYVAASDRYQLRVLDISDPTRPVLVGGFDPSGWNRQEGKVVARFEDSLVLGRTSGGFNIRNDHEAFYWTASSSVFGLGPHVSVDIPGGVYGIIPDRGRLYLATGDIDKELTIMDVSSGGSVATSSARYYPLPVLPQAMACDRHKIYILARTAPAIYEISSHDPYDP